MVDPRVLAGIVLMGIGLVLVKLAELVDWRVNHKPVIDTSTNGGTKRPSFLH